MWIRAAWILLGAWPAWADGEAARVARLEKSLLAPCCWKETIARHQSDVTTRMKLDLEKMIREGRTDAEILATFRQRYGERVVVTPEGDPEPLLFAVPWVLGIAGTGVVVWVLRRWRRAAGAVC